MLALARNPECFQACAAKIPAEQMEQSARNNKLGISNACAAVVHQESSQTSEFKKTTSGQQPVEVEIDTRRSYGEELQGATAGAAPKAARSADPSVFTRCRPASIQVPCRNAFPAEPVVIPVSASSSFAEEPAVVTFDFF